MQLQLSISPSVGIRALFNCVNKPDRAGLFARLRLAPPVACCGEKRSLRRRCMWPILRLQLPVTQLWPRTHGSCETLPFLTAFQLSAEGRPTSQASVFKGAGRCSRSLFARAAAICPEFCSDESQLHGAIGLGNAHLGYDNTYLRLINFEHLSALITVIWDSDHKAQTSCEKGLEEPFNAAA